MVGCATQYVEKTAQDGSSTKYHTTAFFNKTAMTGTIVERETKTTKQLFGQKNSTAETQEDAIKAFFDGMQSLIETSFRQGAKSVAPVP